ncbi:RING finger protein 10-like protein [Corchorus olitorius]|uniref:RING finger protein 10-like protein n=1 Tax=Corchorus olitorius TaxID=93759 RepID=A0A1R3JWR7_9ROSI|nr:RING finger protein 10-like protein [Corchorus olitorius]
MSILPSQAQSSKASSSSQSPSQNPNSNHGNHHQSSPPSISFGSLNISDPSPPFSLSNSPPGPLASAAQDSGGSSKEVSEVETPNGKGSSQQENRGKNPQSRGKMSVNMTSTRNQQGTGSQGSATHSAGRRSQTMNGNHLLNFQYDPIARSRPQPRGPPPRRQRKIKPYNKDLFLQANYKFVLLDTGSDKDKYDPFSKFTFTSDVDLSVRQAISELDSWLARADSGLVDDLEKLPYVCAAMEQLEQRKKYWNEHRASNSNKASGNSISEVDSHGLSSIGNALNTNGDTLSLGGGTLTSRADEQHKGHRNLTTDKSIGGSGLDHTADIAYSQEAQDTLSSSSYEENKDLQEQLGGSRDAKDSDYYNFYQAVDGQHIILHPLNVKCLLNHYGSYDSLPHRISGRILELETITQSEAVRKRYRYLSHFSLTTTFQLCEIDLSGVLPPDALLPFMDEIKKREKQRKQQARKDRKEKIKAEVEAAAQVTPMISGFGRSSYEDSPTFSMDDFEALGSSAVMSSSPPVTGERRLFSNVTRLGFAAGYDSPLKIGEGNTLPNNEVATDSTGVSGDALMPYLLLFVYFSIF